MRRALGRVAPVLLGDGVVLEHQLGAHPAGGERDRGAAVGLQLLGLGPRQPGHRRLGEVVEQVHAEVVGVVLGGAVGDLDDQAAGVADQQRQRVVAGDQVGVDREPEQPEPVVEVVLPHRRVPLEQVLGAPDVVDEHVEAVVVGVDPLDQAADLLGLEVVDRHRDALAARRRHHLGRLLDRLRPVDLGPALAGAAAGRVDGGARLPEGDRDAAAAAARRAGDQRDPAFEWSAHADTLPGQSIRIDSGS